MRGMSTLGEVWQEVEQLSAHCYDELVPVDDISFEGLGEVLIAGEAFLLRPVAQRSLAYRLGIPMNYLARCPLELQAMQMNFWIREERNEKLFFRFDGQAVRAVFTPRYKPLDNLEVLKRLDQMGHGPATKVHCALDGEFMSLSIPDEGETFELMKDAIVPGISVSNSEVGLASLSISAFFLRLVCTNGLIDRAEVRASFRHVSVQILERLPETLRQVSERMDLGRDRFSIAMDTPVADPLATIRTFNRQFNLDKDEQCAVEWAWPAEPGGMMFDVVNTYTRAAQHSGLSAEASHRLQRVGGEILAMVR